MARIRTIKPEFFRHEDLFDAEKSTNLPLRLAYIGLWTVADREGRFKWRPGQLKLDCLPYDDVDFSRVLDALATRGFLVKYESDGEEYGHIPSFCKHQVINNKERESDLPNPLDCNVISTRAPRVPHACPTPLNLSQGEYGKGKGIWKGNMEDTPLPPKGKSYPQDFETFWAIYPKNAASKAATFKSYQKSLKESDNETIIRGAKAYQQYVNRTGTLTAHATTWLNQQRWTVDYDNQVNDHRPSQQSHAAKPSTSDVMRLVLAKRLREGDGSGDDVLQGQQTTTD